MHIKRIFHVEYLITFIQNNIKEDLMKFGNRTLKHKTLPYNGPRSTPEITLSSRDQAGPDPSCLCGNLSTLYLDLSLRWAHSYYRGSRLIASCGDVHCDQPVLLMLDTIEAVLCDAWPSGSGRGESWSCNNNWIICPINKARVRLLIMSTNFPQPGRHLIPSPCCHHKRYNNLAMSDGWIYCTSTFPRYCWLKLNVQLIQFMVPVCI